MSWRGSGNRAFPTPRPPCLRRGSRLSPRSDPWKGSAASARSRLVPHRRHGAVADSPGRRGEGFIKRAREPQKAIDVRQLHGPEHFPTDPGNAQFATVLPCHTIKADERDHRRVKTVSGSMTRPCASIKGVRRRSSNWGAVRSSKMVGARITTQPLGAGYMSPDHAGARRSLAPATASGSCQSATPAPRETCASRLTGFDWR